jgi:hypothetical protein
MKQKQYEYKQYAGNLNQSEMNAFGKDGRLLITLAKQSNYPLWVFVREIFV